MASARIRFAPIYVGSKKVAELQNVTYDITSGDESQIGTEGYLGHSDGAVTVKLSADCIVPVPGVSVDLVTPMINKDYVNVAIQINGKIHQFEGRILSSNFQSDSKSGRTTGKFEFEGGVPELTG